MNNKSNPKDEFLKQCVRLILGSYSLHACHQPSFNASLETYSCHSHVNVEGMV